MPRTVRSLIYLPSNLGQVTAKGLFTVFLFAKLPRLVEKEGIFYALRVKFPPATCLTTQK